MPLIKWTPTIDPFEEVDRFFEELMPAMTLRRGAIRSFVPAVDVYQDKNNVIVEAPLPGVDPKSVSISIENDVLTIEGKTEKKTEVEEKDYYRQEIRRGTFHRAISLPVAVNSQKAKATFDKGVLKIVIPKKEETKAKPVKIQVKS